MQDEMKSPTRLMVDAYHARRPKPGDRWDVVFVRDDGWSLAAPAHLRDAARATWPKQWVKVIECAGTRFGGTRTCQNPDCGR